MKRIIIKSHILPPPQQIYLTNGDSFDSIIELYDDTGLLGIYICNVDSSNNRKDGKVEIKNGKYKGKCLFSERLGKSILILKNGGIELPSIYPNPRHQNKYIATSIMIHSTKGIYSDGSEGCITMPRNKFNEFINHFLLGEECNIEKI
ncbi:MAG: hypothetical protein QXG00_06115 [Candidatus Woesearchaeota archaeon]